MAAKRAKKTAGAKKSAPPLAPLQNGFAISAANQKKEPAAVRGFAFRPEFPAIMHAGLSASAHQMHLALH